MASVEAPRGTVARTEPTLRPEDAIRPHHCARDEGILAAAQFVSEQWESSGTDSSPRSIQGLIEATDAALDGCCKEPAFREVLSLFQYARAHPDEARELYEEREGDEFERMMMVSGHSPFSGQFFACEQWVHFSEVALKPGLGVRLFNGACVPPGTRPVHPQLMDGTHDEDYARDTDTWTRLPDWQQSPCVTAWAADLLQSEKPSDGRVYFSEILQRYDVVFDSRDARVVLQLAAGLGLERHPSEYLNTKT